MIGLRTTVLFFAGFDSAEHVCSIANAPPNITHPMNQSLCSFRPPNVPKTLTTDSREFSLIECWCNDAKYRTNGECWLRERDVCTSDH